MEIVIDTNVFVNGIFTHGVNATDQACKTIMREAMTGKIISPIGNTKIIGEYLWVLVARLEQLIGRVKREEFRNHYLNAVRQLIQEVQIYPSNTTIPPHWIDDSDDPEKTDKMFLECAVDAGANIVISDDHSIKHFIQYNTTMGNDDALQFIQRHGLQLYDPITFVKQYLT